MQTYTARLQLALIEIGYVFKKIDEIWSCFDGENGAIIASHKELGKLASIVEEMIGGI